MVSLLLGRVIVLWMLIGDIYGGAIVKGGVNLGTGLLRVGAKNFWKIF